MRFRKFGFIGLGLIGGSIARAIREQYPEAELTAYDPNPDFLQEAVRDRVIDHAADEIGPLFTGLDLIYLCAPVQYNNENLHNLKAFLSPDTVVTDIGSVKSDIDLCVNREGLSGQFVGGHPMTGSERIGYPNSRAKLLENAYYILTPTADADQKMLLTMQEFTKSLGAIPLFLSPDEHDYITGAVSHLPHIISASLVNLVRKSDGPEGLMKQIAAGGFKDITRISSSSPVMWQQICLTNTENILTLLDRYMESLQAVRSLLAGKDADALFQFFESARSYRESFTEVTSGPIQKEYVLHVDIADAPGTLAGVLSLLSEKKLNIKNIGITHNREDEYGSLRLEFYNDKALQTAGDCLSVQGFTLS